MFKPRSQGLLHHFPPYPSKLSPNTRPRTSLLLATPPNASPSFKGWFMPSFLSPWNFYSTSSWHTELSDSLVSVHLFLAVGLQLPEDRDFVSSVTFPYQDVGK